MIAYFSGDPSELDPGLLHGGLEYRHPDPFVRVTALGFVRWVGAVDLKSWQEDGWSPAWSIKTGLEFGPNQNAAKPGRHWSLLFEWYDGFAPYGQFFDEDVSYLGAGLQLSL